MTRRGDHARLATVCFAAVTNIAALAHAGNDEGYLLGNQAALSGGAVTAFVSEGSAIWYNPAGVAAVASDSLDLSASAYGIRYYSVPRFVVAENEEHTPVAITEFVIVPSAAAYVRALTDDLRFGFGVFAPRSNDAVLRSDLDAGDDGRWIFSEVVFDRSTYGGLSLGWRANDRLRLGVSLLGFYRFEQTELQFAGGRPTGSGAAVTFFSSSSNETRTTLGGLVSVGAQWDVDPHWKLGLTVRSPQLNVFSNSTESSFVSAAMEGSSTPPLYEPDSDRMNRGDFTVTAPLQVRGGVSTQWGGTTLSVDGDLSPGLAASTGNELDAKFNVRVGASYQILDQLAMGGGLFTDRDATPRTETSGPLHFFGGSAGVRWGKVYTVESDKAPRAFDFVTTLALRYAYGRGRASGLRVSISDVGGVAVPQADEGTSSLTVHELMMHVGSGFLF